MIASRFASRSNPYFLFSLFVSLLLMVLPANAASIYTNKQVAGEAGRYDALMKQIHKSASKNINDLMRSGRALVNAKKNYRKAVSFFEAAYVAGAGTNALLQLARAQLWTKTENYKERYTFPERAGAAAYMAYQGAQTTRDKAYALSLLGSAFERRQSWRASLTVLQSSLKYLEQASARKKYNALYKKHGFRMLDYNIDSNSTAPRLCANFSEILKKGADYAKYTVLQGSNKPAVTTSGRQLCIDGLQHGKRYKVKFRAGIPAQIDDDLKKSVEISVYVKDRSPSVRLSGNKYVLPRSGQIGIPMTSVNTKIIYAKIYRYSDRGLGSAVQGDFLKQLAGYNVEELKDRLGERIWEGTLDVAQKLNKDVITAFPVQKAIPNLQSGLYVMVADTTNKPADDWKRKTTQWFIVSDLGLSGLIGKDGVHAFVRSLESADMISGATIRLIAKNNQVLGTQTTDGGGFVSFSASLARGEGGMSPAMIVAQTKHGDYAFLDLTSPAFDLSDRGVTGRATPGPVDVQLFSERGVYKPGEVVHVTGLARDLEAKALSNLPLTFKFMRPDNREYKRYVVKDQGLGGRTFSLSLPASAKTGTWQVLAYTDVKGDALGKTSFLVEDFVPERMDLTVSSKTTALSAQTPLKINLDGKYLYGAPAKDHAIEGEMQITENTNEIKGFKGYHFGLLSEKVKATRHIFNDLPRTDDSGKAVAITKLPVLPESTKPLQAKITLRLRDPSGRSIERKMSVPVEPRTALIGIKPLFDDLSENSTAAFDVAVMGVNGKQRDFKNLTWELVKLNSRYQWYQNDGRWSHERITSEERLATGTIDALADQPIRLSSAIKWGQFRLEVRSDDNGRPAASYEFNAGWYATAVSDTPDMLDVALDKTDYNVGETAKLRIVSRMPGKALITVLNGGIRAMKTVSVPKGSSTTDMIVDDSWGAGAYVAVSLYRPMNINNKRMPSRAIGITWLNAGHNKRVLTLNLQTPQKIRPDESLDVPITLKGLTPGAKAYVVASAVDVGILNLTGYQPPSPEKHFLSQRQLGTEFRDLYGRLIDGMQGVRGSIRSGGDGPGAAGGMNMNGNPPDQRSLALFSGVVAVDEQGKAILHFDIPAFNGTVKIMAVAWSKDKMGHAAKDVIVRDQVIVTGTTPRFLTKGDHSQLHLVLHNVEGSQGDYDLQLTSALGNEGEGTITASQNFKVKLAFDQKHTIRIPLTPNAIGKAMVSIHLTGPDGIDIARDYVIPVKPAYPSVTRQSVRTVSAGNKLILSSDIFTGLVSGTEKATLSIGPANLPDIPGLLTSLDRYPYGCSEQITSRALPLLYLSSVAERAGILEEKDQDLKKTIQKAIDKLISRQGHNGSFGLWSTSNGSSWLTAYVTEFLTRAREKGFDVPQRNLTFALDKLSNTLKYASDFKYGGESVAYSLYVLARNKRARLSELRYYADEKLNAFANPMAKAQLATALSMYGDQVRAKKVYYNALGKLDKELGVNRRRYSSDYGSSLRDGAATLALVSETGLRNSLLPSLGHVLEKHQSNMAAPRTNTQEKAWLLLAANALFEEAKTYQLDLNGTRHTGTLVKSLASDDLQTPYQVTNMGDANARATITISGSPETPEPPRANGFTIKREYFTLTGEKVDPSRVAQNTRLITVIKVQEGKPIGGQIMISDPLPAGFEIDNPRLVSSADLSALSWLEKSTPKHVEFRDDRFLAAYDLKKGNASSVSTAYVIRAVAPGRYTHGPASVEDMYRPERVASTASGFVEIVNEK
ncbi:MAG: alpha-2-macroglobulin family protein [bacterium]|nr:alpha-2-macroglobulin family protein [bacterium]